MATRETARLERETEETRAQLEQTLGELRARMSPGQLIDQASDYFRNNSGRAYLHHLRDEVVHNPMPVALIGAGIAWLAISGTMGRRHNGGNGSVERDWGRTAGIAEDLSHGGSGPSATQRARQRAEDWVDEARESAGDMSARASTAYDEAVGAARQTAEGWTEEASSTAHEAREALREGMGAVRGRASHARDRASEMYEHTAGGVRRVARRAADYGRAARHSFDRDGPLVNFCREQPMLVAGIGLAVGAALAAMIPTSRPERQVMGDASRAMQDRVRDMADRNGDGWQGGATASEFDRGVREAAQSPNVETAPQSAAPYAEAAEAGAAAPSEAAPGESALGESALGEAVPGEEIKPRS